MKHFKCRHLAILPLLSILSMSPGVMESKFAVRSLASVIEEVKGHPKFEALVSKVDQKSLLKDDNLDLEPRKKKILRLIGFNFVKGGLKELQERKVNYTAKDWDNLDLEKFKNKRKDLEDKLLKEKNEFKKDQSDKDIVLEQRKKIESLVIDVLLIEGGLKDLQERKVTDTAVDEESTKMINQSKDVVEGLLTDLEANEVLVAKASEPKKEGPKKEEEKPVVAEEPKKEEPKKEICESDEKNKVLTAQVEQLLKQQNQIMQTILGMAQMMVSMHQQQQPNPYFSNGPGFNIQNPYQYHSPFTAGNWVYMPNGPQPYQQQPNIFAQPMIPQMQQQQSIYPDQMHQQMQSNWNLQPDPRFQYRPSIPNGNFGNNGLSFNMENMVPTISQG